MEFDTPSTAKIPLAQASQVQLQSLLGLFPDTPLAAAEIETIEGSLMPEPYHQLLVHRHHMTVTLEAHHRSILALRVLETRHRGDEYARHLILTAGNSPRPVLWGVMRIQLQHVSPEVRAAILAETTPLGRILIEQEVSRWIEPQFYVQVKLNAVLQRGFEAPGAEVTYGRVARLICDNSPAVDLLEIVRPEG